MDNYKRLLRLYRETKDDIYFNDLYELCKKIKLNFMKYNNFFYIDTEAVYDDAFLKAAYKYKLTSNVKFSTFLYCILTNDIRSQLRTEYKFSTNNIDINRIFNIEKGTGEHSDSIEKDISDNTNIEKDYIDSEEYIRLLNFLNEQLDKYSKKHDKCKNIHFIVINRLMNNKPFDIIAKEVGKSINGTKANYYKFIKTFKIVYGRHYKK